MKRYNRGEEIAEKLEVKRKMEMVVLEVGNEVEVVLLKKSAI